MRCVIALGGNALLRRGEPMTAEHQRKNVRLACEQIARVIINNPRQESQEKNEFVLVHGNGPQVGLLALQGAAYDPQHPYPLDVLGAETEGMIGYLIEQELGNALLRRMSALVGNLKSDVSKDAIPTVVSLLTQVEVDATDPAFSHPTKPIGPVYTALDVNQLKQERQAQYLPEWFFVVEGSGFRRVVPSPQPKQVAALEPIAWLLEKNCVVICAGGGGIPTVWLEGERVGVEAVVDKDWCAAMLARQLQADLLIIATDVDGVYLDWGLPTQQQIERITPDQLSQLKFPAGSMGPKVEAACDFVLRTKHRCVIGSLNEIEAMMKGRAGTIIQDL
jgi:carbamate kinase